MPYNWDGLTVRGMGSRPCAAAKVITSFCKSRSRRKLTYKKLALPHAGSSTRTAARRWEKVWSFEFRVASFRFQVSASLHITPSRATSSKGLNLDGAKWYFYQTGTTTPQSVYTTAALDTTHANPVVADAAGKFANIYFDSSLEYRGVLKTSDDATTTS